MRHEIGWPPGAALTIIFGIVSAALISGTIVVVAVGCEGSPTEHPPQASVALTATPPSTEIAGIGRPVSGGGWEVTLEGAREEDELRYRGPVSSETYTPKTGFTFLVVDVTLRNVDPTQETKLASSDFAITSEDGQVFKPVGKVLEHDPIATSNYIVGATFTVTQEGNELDLGLVFAVNKDAAGQILRLQFLQVPPIPFSVDSATTPTAEPSSVVSALSPTPSPTPVATSTATPTVSPPTVPPTTVPPPTVPTGEAPELSVTWDAPAYFQYGERAVIWIEVCNEGGDASLFTDGAIGGYSTGAGNYSIDSGQCLDLGFAGGTVEQYVQDGKVSYWVYLEATNAHGGDTYDETHWILVVGIP